MKRRSVVPRFTHARKRSCRKAIKTVIRLGHERRTQLRLTSNDQT